MLYFSAIMEFRKANLDAFVKKYGIKLGFMSVFTKAAAYALQDQPVVNAVIDGNVILMIINQYNGNKFNDTFYVGRKLFTVIMWIFQLQ